MLMDSGCLLILVRARGGETFAHLLKCRCINLATPIALTQYFYGGGATCWHTRDFRRCHWVSPVELADQCPDKYYQQRYPERHAQYHQEHDAPAETISTKHATLSTHHRSILTFLFTHGCRKQKLPCSLAYDVSLAIQGPPGGSSDHSPQLTRLALSGRSLRRKRHESAMCIVMKR